MATLAAMILQPAAQATPQLADLKVKQSMSVQAGTQVSLTGKTLTAIPLASYTAANVTDGKMVGYDLTPYPRCAMPSRRRPRISAPRRKT